METGHQGSVEGRGRLTPLPLQAQGLAKAKGSPPARPWPAPGGAKPLAGLRVYAGVRSFDLAAWLSQEIGQTVTLLDFNALFPALAELSAEDQMACLPVLGVLLRNEVAAT